MDFHPRDTKKLSDIQVSTLLGLALTLPIRYEDTRLHKPFIHNEYITVYALVEAKSVTPKRVSYRLRCDDGTIVHAVFFSPRRYQQTLFSIGESYYLYGKVTTFPELTLIHPKKVSDVNTIIPIYSTGPRNKTYRALMQTYLKTDALCLEGLDELSADVLYSIHFPTSNVTMSDEIIQHTLKLTEIFSYLRAMSEKKTVSPAQSVRINSLSSFYKKLPFALTQGQKNAINDIANDLRSNIQAKRVIIGDVGCGKTMVILACAQMCGTKKSLLLAPTSVLANQLYEEARTYLSLKTVLVTQASHAHDSELDNADFLIGTHALLYRKLPICAAVMVDEQHRFGTQQRHMIAKLTSSGTEKPHFFQFSATPIPRTQALIETSLADVTFIRDIPFQKHIKTHIIGRDDFPMLLAHIREQINLHKQIALIYPSVESDAKGYMPLTQAEQFWRSHFENVFVTHGKDTEKEEVFSRFRDEGDILITTTVMEVGISFPRLSTIIVVGAEQLGLATLHQLRGRVSRHGDAGWCFLFSRTVKQPRLEQFAKTTSGFEIAELDLTYRQSGDIIEGSIQSGKQFSYFDMQTDYAIAEEAKQLLERFLMRRQVQ